MNEIAATTLDRIAEYVGELRYDENFIKTVLDICGSDQRDVVLKTIAHVEGVIENEF